jgi:hypothetical protein
MPRLHEEVRYPIGCARRRWLYHIKRVEVLDIRNRDMPQLEDRPTHPD